MAKAIKSDSKGWWAYLLIGILAILLGISFLSSLQFAVITIFLVTGIYFLVSGIGSAITTILDRKYIDLWILKLILHIFVAIIGILMLCNPIFTFSFVWIVCGIGFFFDGIAMIILSIGLKKANVSSWVLLLILGILIILASFAVMNRPMLSILIVTISAAVSAICYGINNIIYAIKVKG